MTADKIVVNHYFYKSREEYIKKVQLGRADLTISDYDIKSFSNELNNDIFDDGILHYRAACEENFSLEDDTQRYRRVLNALVETLSTFAESTGSDLKMETALTCRALSTYLREKFPDLERMKLYEEASLEAVLKSFVGMKYTDARIFFRDLPDLLTLPYPVVKDIRRATRELIPQMLDVFRLSDMWRDYVEMNYLLDLLKLIKE